MVGANLTEFNLRILDLPQRPQVQGDRICEMERKWSDVIDTWAWIGPRRDQKRKPTLV